MFFKTLDAEGIWSEWQAFHQPVAKKWWHLFLNPELNLQLAEKSALQHAVQDLLEAEDVKNPISLQIVQNIVQSHLSSEVQDFHFKISLYDGLRWEDVFTSEDSP